MTTVLSSTFCHFIRCFRDRRELLTVILRVLPFNKEVYMVIYVDDFGVGCVNHRRNVFFIELGLSLAFLPSWTLCLGANVSISSWSHLVVLALLTLVSGAMVSMVLKAISKMVPHLLRCGVGSCANTLARQHRDPNRVGSQLRTFVKPLTWYDCILQRANSFGGDRLWWNCSGSPWSYTRLESTSTWKIRRYRTRVLPVGRSGTHMFQRISCQIRLQRCFLLAPSWPCSSFDRLLQEDTPFFLSCRWKVQVYLCTLTLVALRLGRVQISWHFS